MVVVVILAALPVNAGGLVVPVIVVILVLVQIRPVELVVTQLMVYLVAFPVAVAVADPLIAAADTAIPADIAANSLTSIIATGAATRLAYIVLVALVVVQSVTD